MHVIHSLQKLDLSRRFLIEDLQQFNSHKQPLTLHILGGRLQEVGPYMKMLILKMRATSMHTFF